MFGESVIARSISYSGELLTCQTVQPREADLRISAKNERTDTAAN